MHEELPGYLSAALEIAETLFVEPSLADSAEAQRQLEALCLAIAPLELLRQEIEAPEGLAHRTCQRIGEVRNSRID